MRNIVRLCFAALILFTGCVGKGAHTGIPKTASLAAESGNYSFFLNRENESGAVTLWLYDSVADTSALIVRTHPNARREWFPTDESVTAAVDSIHTISSVTVLSTEVPVRLLVEGCSDYRNVESFIVTVWSDTAIALPTNMGLMGISSEEYLLIMESYDYYEEGGRYSVIEAFDLGGNRLGGMRPKLWKSKESI